MINADRDVVHARVVDVLDGLRQTGVVLYPATSLHRVNPVTRGVRFASFFWIQSMVREDAQRALLFDMDLAINQVNQALPNHPAVVALTSCYHNLLRAWSGV